MIDEKTSRVDLDLRLSGKFVGIDAESFMKNVIYQNERIIGLLEQIADTLNTVDDNVRMIE